MSRPRSRCDSRTGSRTAGEHVHHCREASDPTARDNGASHGYKTYGDFEVIEVTDLNGHVVGSSRSGTAFAVANRSWFRTVVTGKPVITTMTSEEGHLRWIVAAPIFGRDGRPEGVVAGDLDESVLAEVLSPKLQTGSEVSAVDQDQSIYDTSMGAVPDGGDARGRDVAHEGRQRRGDQGAVRGYRQHLADRPTAQRDRRLRLSEQPHMGDSRFAAEVGRAGSDCDATRARSGSSLPAQSSRHSSHSGLPAARRAVCAPLPTRHEREQ